MMLQGFEISFNKLPSVEQTHNTNSVMIKVSLSKSHYTGQPKSKKTPAICYALADFTKQIHVYHYVSNSGPLLPYQPQYLIISQDLHYL